MIAAVFQHFRLTLRLNFRSKPALVYGYFVPFLFLVAYGSVFRGDQPVLWHEMGALLTLTILGGTCFGLPTALVAERERGVWKRYRLLPVGISSLVLSTVLARVLLVASASLLQIGLARAMYGTPFPLHPLAALAALLLTILAFIGLGLLVAALAPDVPAVQALGQCLFLPMVMLGGVGIPLAALPVWAQRVACFMPGRYAVEMLQAAYSQPAGLHGTGYSAIALLVIGAAAALSGARLFRWEPGRAAGLRARLWIGIALSGWAAIGVGAIAQHRVAPLDLSGTLWSQISADQLKQITYDDLPGDNELVTRLAPPFGFSAPPPRVEQLTSLWRKWAPGRVADTGQRVRNFVCLATIADVSADRDEAEIARAVFDWLVATTDENDLRRALGWIILAPNEGTVITSAPEFGFSHSVSERMVRERSVYYAKKYLGRLLGKIHELPPAEKR